MTLKPCPQEVINAGALLLVARRDAASLNTVIDEAIATLEKSAIPVMVGHGAKEMQAGVALNALQDARKSRNYVCIAHDSLRPVLAECGYAEPTDEQLLKAAVDLGLGTLGWR